MTAGFYNPRQDPKKVKNLDIRFIRHKDHRYETVGDYYFHGKDTIRINISRMSDWRYMFLVLIHELIELCLVMNDGISIEEIEAFDKAFEANRKPGNTDEPGDDPRAPYCQHHQFATRIEKSFAVALGVNWAKYDRTVCSL